MKPQDSFLTSEKFCVVLEFLKCLLACAAGGFVAYASKKGDIRSPFSLLCGHVYFIVRFVLQRDRLFKDVQFWKGINKVVVIWLSDDDENDDNDDEN